MFVEMTLHPSSDWHGWYSQDGGQLKISPLHIVSYAQSGVTGYRSIVLVNGPKDFIALHVLENNRTLEERIKDAVRAWNLPARGFGVPGV